MFGAADSGGHGLAFEHECPVKGGIEIGVDPNSLFSVGQIKLRVMVHVDVALLRPDAFAVASVT